MNKKGSFGFFFYIIILLALIVGFSVTTSSNFNINSFKENFNWTDINLTTLENAPDLGNALESLVNGIGEALFSVMKFVAQWSYENPTIPYKALIILVIIAIFAPILYYLAQFLIVLFIVLKEWIVSRREKKELRRLR